MKLKEAPFKVGDKVTTKYDLSMASLVRTVSYVAQDNCCQTGWMINVERIKCEHCNHCIPPFMPGGIDSNWFRKVDA